MATPTPTPTLKPRERRSLLGSDIGVGNTLGELVGVLNDEDGDISEEEGAIVNDVDADKNIPAVAVTVGRSSSIFM
ncbi:hypothetical protein LOZ66_003863 [Ophidiomyces ophidiicola]|nr:hypothetical protein LOZ66_003863 [Ophidiomyces ophidiicola]